MTDRQDVDGTEAAIKLGGFSALRAPNLSIRLRRHTPAGIQPLCNKLHTGLLKSTPFVLK